MKFLALASLLIPAMVWSKPDLATKLDQITLTTIQNRKIVGSVVIVARDGKVLYRKAHGLADRESKIPMKEDAMFRLASMTKPIVALATLQAIQDGYLKLEDPVTKWLPEFKPKLQDGTTPTITVKQLLTHTAGLNYSFFEEPKGPYHKLKVSDGMDTYGISMEDNLKRLAKAPLLYSPGTSWNYSISVDVLGAVLEKAVKLPLDKIVSMWVTNPLKMSSTKFVVIDPNDKQRLATPYADGKDSPTRMTTNHFNPFGLSGVVMSPERAFSKKEFLSGGAGLIGSADDYLVFLENLRTGPTQIFSNLTGDLPIVAKGKGWAWSPAGALLLDKTVTKTSLSKGSIEWGGAYGHTWWVDPKEKLTVVILTNTAFEGMSGKYPDEIKEGVYQSLK